MCDERVVKSGDGGMNNSSFGWILSTMGEDSTVLREKKWEILDFGSEKNDYKMTYFLRDMTQ